MLLLPGNSCEDCPGPALCVLCVPCVGHIVQHLRTALPEDAHPVWFLPYPQHVLPTGLLMIYLIPSRSPVSSPLLLESSLKAELIIEQKPGTQLLLFIKEIKNMPPVFHKHLLGILSLFSRHGKKLVNSLKNRVNITKISPLPDWGFYTVIINLGIVRGQRNLEKGNVSLE